MISRSVKDSLGLVMVVTSVAIFIVMRGAMDPTGYYRGGGEPNGGEFVPSYTGMAMTCITCWTFAGRSG
jgi:hypothetical protein